MAAAGDLTARDAVLVLLAARKPHATICPSEVARALVAETAGQAWRGTMPSVHRAVDQLLRDGVVRLSWKGKRLGERAGPYRIGLASPAVRG